MSDGAKYYLMCSLKIKNKIGGQLIIFFMKRPLVAENLKKCTKTCTFCYAVIQLLFVLQTYLSLFIKIYMMYILLHDHMAFDLSHDLK